MNMFPATTSATIHWKTYARLGTLMVRQFVDTRRSELALVASTLREEYASDEEFELAISVVGSIGRSAITDEQGVSCVMGGRVIPCFANEVFLDGLAGIKSDDADILRTAQRARGETGRASVVLLISGSQCSLAAHARGGRPQRHRGPGDHHAHRRRQCPADADGGPAHPAHARLAAGALRRAPQGDLMTSPAATSAAPAGARQGARPFSSGSAPLSPRDSTFSSVSSSRGSDWLASPPASTVRAT